MKTPYWVFVIAVLAWTPAPAQVSVGFGAFYSSLSPHGEWIAVDGGTYAWHPTGVGPEWRPYYNGQWVWTDDGWYWSSDEPWGWATYHYGRWYYDDYYGWVWVPGYEWAPAWVEWRYGGSCVGWAPLSPYAVFSASWGIHYRRYWATPYHYWSFVDCRYIGSPGVNRYVYRRQENVRYIGSTRTAGSIRYSGGRIVTGGPDRDFVERRGNIRVNRAEMVDVHERGEMGLRREAGRDRLAVYRPSVEQGSRELNTERPERVRDNERRIALDMRGTDIRRSTDFTQPGRAAPPRLDDRRINNGRTPGNVQPVQPQRYQPGGRPERGGDRPVVRPDYPYRPDRMSSRPGYGVPAPRGDRRGERWNAQPQRGAPPGAGTMRSGRGSSPQTPRGGNNRGERSGRR